MGLNSYNIQYSIVKRSCAKLNIILYILKGKKRTYTANASIAFPSVFFSIWFVSFDIVQRARSKKKKQQTNGIMLLKCRRTSKHKKKIAAYIHYSPIHRIFGIISAYILHAGIINSNAAAMKSNKPLPPNLSTNFLMVCSVRCEFYIFRCFFFLSRYRFVFFFFIQPYYSNKSLCAYLCVISSEI